MYAMKKETSESIPPELIKFAYEIFFILYCATINILSIAEPASVVKSAGIFYGNFYIYRK